MNFKMMFEGKESLARTYWLYGILIFFVTWILLNFVFINFIIISIIISVSAFIYRFFVLIGMYRALSNYSGNVFFKILAGLFLIIGWLSTPKAFTEMLTYFK